ncbi:MAG: hypothetical protein LBD11_08030 [Candidatus Peribacteria bacterium]|jgi:hypothetical protein|nr:hypothetical protein [Candidatus Peribacteria bacterium]
MRHYGLNPLELPDFIFERELSFNKYINETITSGKGILSFLSQKNAFECKKYAFEAEVAGYKAICLNTPEAFAIAFDSVYDPKEHQLMMSFCTTGEHVKFSLFTTHDEINCGEIAKSYGGGGNQGTGSGKINLHKLQEFLQTKSM